MSFSTDMAKLVTDQLNRFLKLESHELAGHVANLDFWLDQVRHVLGIIDGYGVRFVKMETAQNLTNRVHTRREHGVDVETTAPSRKLRRVPGVALTGARNELVEAARQFLERCRERKLINAKELSSALAGIGLGTTG